MQSGASVLSDGCVWGRWRPALRPAPRHAAAVAALQSQPPLPAGPAPLSVEHVACITARRTSVSLAERRGGPRPVEGPRQCGLERSQLIAGAQPLLPGDRDYLDLAAMRPARGSARRAPRQLPARRLPARCARCDRLTNPTAPRGSRSSPGRNIHSAARAAALCCVRLLPLASSLSSRRCSNSSPTFARANNGPVRVQARGPGRLKGLPRGVAEAVGLRGERSGPPGRRSRRRIAGCARVAV